MTHDDNSVWRNTPWLGLNCSIPERPDDWGCEVAETEEIYAGYSREYYVDPSKR